MIGNEKKTLVLFCGGTIIMTKQKNAQGEEVLMPPADVKDSIRILQNLVPELNITAQDIEYIANIDSTEMKPEHWERILKVIEETYDRYDGFVITHGTDTLAYTAAALNIALENLNKPVVLTGSQIPGCDINTDARRNFVNALLLAEQDIRGVYVVFDERIIAGGRATKVSESRLDAYRSVNKGNIGEIRVNMDLSSCPKKHENSAALKVNRGFFRDILVYHVFPGCDPTDLLFLLEKEKYGGIILRGYGTANLPVDFKAFFEAAEKKKFPVVVNTQCLNGKTVIGDYESGSWFMKYSVCIDGRDQNIETLVVKLQHALSVRKGDIAGIKAIMMKNFSGELDS